MNIGAIQKAIDAGKLDAKGTLDHDALKAAGLARGGKDGVRLLGKGELKAKLAFKVAGVSKGAREAVEKAGGSIELIERKNPAELAAAKKGKVARSGSPTGRCQGLKGLRQAAQSHYIGGGEALQPYRRRSFFRGFSVDGIRSRTTRLQHHARQFPEGDRAQEEAVVHARRADPVPAAVVRSGARASTRWR